MGRYYGSFYLADWKLAIEKNKDMSFKTVIKYYKLTAIILLNILLLFLLANILCFIGFKIKDAYFQKYNPVSKKYAQSLLEVYPGLSEREIKDLLNETWSRNYVYEPFTQFKERPYTGKYVNVDKNGFRVSKNQGPWPPEPENYNIFLFGGSSTFNYGLPDDQTIASYLQEYLSQVKQVKVYNFGRGNYFSTQERILFEQLLTSGNIPDLAIFIDGLNEFYYSEDKPVFTKHFENIVGDRVRAFKYLSLRSLEMLPITKLAQTFGNLIPKKKEQEEIYNDTSLINGVINRYLENKKIIEAVAGAYNFTPVFVWQPIPLYKYDLKYHPFAEGDFERHTYAKYGYPQMENFVKDGGDNFFWLADIQKEVQEPLYLDKVHYTARMSQKLAKTISDLLVERNLLPR